MAGSLESVLANIPGYGGYLAKRQYDENQQTGELQKAHTLQSILAAIQQQEMLKQFSGAMSGGGTPEQMDAVATRMALAGHAGAPSILAIADKRRKAAEEATAAAAQMKAIRSPAPEPVQSAPDPEGLKMVADHPGSQPMIPGTNFTNPTAAQVPPEERAAFDKVLNDARTKNATARGEGGLFASLMESEIPSIANRAKIMQQQANVAPASQASKWEAAYERLAKENTALLERKGTSSKESPLSQLIRERDALPPNHTNRAVYDAAIKKTSEGSIAGGGEFSPEALRMTAEQYLTGDRQAIQGYARNSSARIALQNEIVKVAKEKGWGGSDIAAQMADFAGIMSGSRTVGTRAVQIELASSEAEKMIDIVLQRSKGFERTQFVPINQALKAFETQTGQPEVKAFGASINSLVNVYARAISPSGVPTVSDKEHAREMLAAADSPAQVQAVMDVMRQEMKAARAAPGEVRASTRRAVTGNEPAATPTAPAAGPSIEDRLKKYK
jgi:hypothetical protein